MNPISSPVGLGLNVDSGNAVDDKENHTLCRRHTINEKPGYLTNKIDRLDKADVKDRLECTPESRDKSNSQRKRRSLNLSLSFSYPSENDALISPNSDSSSSSSSSRGPLSPRYVNNIDESVSIRSSSRTPDIQLSRKGSLTPSSRPKSFLLALEQERMLQEQLQRLARTENARLMDGHSSPNVPSDIINSIASSPSPLPSNFTSTTILESAAGILSPMIDNSKRLHSRNLSLDVRSISTTSSNASRKTRKTRKSTSSVGSRSSPIAFDKDSMFIIRPQDIEMLQSKQSKTHKEEFASRSSSTTDTNKNADEPSPINGPTRPGNVEGTTLSWKMTSDLLTTSAKSIVSIKDILEIASFVWSMFSRTENIQSILNFNESKSLLPPSEVVTALRQKLPTFVQLKDFTVKIACASFSASIVCVQVSLLMLMVVAYIIGDVLIVPGKYFARLINETQAKKRLKKPIRKITQAK